MRTTNIRELKHATATVLEWVDQGETVQVTRRNKVIAILSPPERTADEATREEIRSYDFEADLKEIFGDRTMSKTAAELLAEEREDR